MTAVVDAAVSALEPWVGRMAADTCMRATAIAVGKTSDELGVADLPAIDENIRRLLLPIAPAPAIVAILETIHGAAS